MIWTPIVAPGDSSTTLPVDHPEPPVYAGATVTPVEGRIDSFPAAAEAGFDDFITVFPVNSGLPPIYVFFRDRREDPGVVTGNGQSITGSWLGAASQGEGSPIPSQIADKLKGQEFKNFRAFREAFWKSIANDSELANQFNRQNLQRILNGKAPYTSELEHAGKSGKFELHHKIFISKGGDVFDIDNIYIVTPKLHKQIHGKGN
ncbi:S-type pyocin domain-containing protein [Pseudomonas sp. W15Feb34]|uniref:S-type pyocin domain-containing protein n=1 Tax=Pseudomonas sp. W15Feb34 TaxID=550727 RepID=UPI00200461EA|nr:S-type pyocin domain-containing protein [Pseudomonas sp. W15Feb34]